MLAIKSLMIILHDLLTTLTPQRLELADTFTECKSMLVDTIQFSEVV